MQPYHNDSQFGQKHALTLNLQIWQVQAFHIKPAFIFTSWRVTYEKLKLLQQTVGVASLASLGFMQ